MLVRQVEQVDVLPHQVARARLAELRGHVEAGELDLVVEAGRHLERDELGEVVALARTRAIGQLNRLAAVRAVGTRDCVEVLALLHGIARRVALLRAFEEALAAGRADARRRGVALFKGFELERDRRLQAADRELRAVGLQREGERRRAKGRVADVGAPHILRARPEHRTNTVHVGQVHVVGGRDTSGALAETPPPAICCRHHERCLCHVRARDLGGWRAHLYAAQERAAEHLDASDQRPRHVAAGGATARGVEHRPQRVYREASFLPGNHTSLAGEQAAQELVDRVQGHWRHAWRRHARRRLRRRRRRRRVDGVELDVSVEVLDRVEVDVRGGREREAGWGLGLGLGLGSGLGLGVGLGLGPHLVSIVISQPELASSAPSSAARVALSDVACALRLSISSEMDSRDDSAEYVIVIVVQSPSALLTCKRRRSRPPLLRPLDARCAARDGGRRPRETGRWAKARLGAGAEAPSLGATLEAKLAPGSQGAKWEPGSQGVPVGVAVRVAVPAKAAVRL
eukprot:scaffold84517_cov55-Phaeocystis_antarctica.AAC.1